MSFIASSSKALLSDASGPRSSCESVAKNWSLLRSACPASSSNDRILRGRRFGFGLRLPQRRDRTDNRRRHEDKRQDVDPVDRVPETKIKRADGRNEKPVRRQISQHDREDSGTGPTEPGRDRDGGNEQQKRPVLAQPGIQQQANPERHGDCRGGNDVGQEA